MLDLKMHRIRLFEPFFWIYFVWYSFPMARAFFRSDAYNLIFFGIFALGCVFCLAEIFSHDSILRFKFNALVPVLVYFFVFAILVLLGVGDSKDHIRVSFTFWGSLLTFYMLTPIPEAKTRLTKLMLLTFSITAVTSLIGVISNPRAARLLTYAANSIDEDIALRMLNIGDISFFQGLVACVPILMTFIVKNKYRLFSIICLAFVFAALLSASFTISLLVFFIAIAVGFLVNNSSVKRGIIVVCLAIMLILVPWDSLLFFIASKFGNDYVGDRLSALSVFFSTGSLTGDVASRIDVYLTSLETFISHPFGIGAEYSHVTFQNGIGYHSQILDDMARYGIFAIAFYGCFFKKYIDLLKMQWRKVGMEQVAIAITAVYLCFLVLNPGFTSPHESVLILFILPAIPDVMGKKQMTENQIYSQL